jgi:prepilin peptidase CpaA
MYTGVHTNPQIFTGNVLKSGPIHFFIALDGKLLSDSYVFNNKRLVMHSAIVWWPTLIVVAVATITDLRSRRIPNWLVLPFLLAGIVVSGWLHGWSGVGHSFAGIALGGLLFGILAFMGGMGMGDVKLCAAIGAWIWPGQLITALVLTGIAGGIMALCWAAAGGFLGELFSGAGNLVFGFRKRGLKPDPELNLGNPRARKMPYAPAIAIGTLVSFFAR